MGLYPLKSDQSIYLNKEGNLVLMSHVDDLTILSPQSSKIQSLMGQLAQSIDIKDLDDIDEFLGIKIRRNRVKRAIFLDQSQYIDKILSEFGYKNKKALKLGNPFPIGVNIEPLEGLA